MASESINSETLHTHTHSLKLIGLSLCESKKLINDKFDKERFNCPEWINIQLKMFK